MLPERASQLAKILKALGYCVCKVTTDKSPIQEVVLLQVPLTCYGIRIEVIPRQSKDHIGRTSYCTLFRRASGCSSHLASSVTIANATTIEELKLAIDSRLNLEILHMIRK